VQHKANSKSLDRYVNKKQAGKVHVRPPLNLVGKLIMANKKWQTRIKVAAEIVDPLV